MNRQSVCAALVLTLVLLMGCVSKTPAELARADGTEEAASAVEALEFAPREAYHLAEIEVQSVEDGAVLTVDGVCELSVKGFGCGKTITADGKTCAGAKTGETLVWLTCDYTNLTENEVSPGRLLESGLLRYDSGSAEGKSASFAKLLPGETAEVYFYYAIPESLTEQPLTLQFTIGTQTYSYEIPADKSAALAPTAPEEAEPDEETEDTEQITLQEPPKQEETKQGTSAAVKQEQPDQKKTEKPKEEKTNSEETSGAANTSDGPVKTELNNGRYMLRYYDAAGRLINEEYYDSNGNRSSYFVTEYDSAGQRTKYTMYDGVGNWLERHYYENGRATKIEYVDGRYRLYKYEWSDQFAVIEYSADGVAQDGIEYYDWNSQFLRIEYADGTIGYDRWNR